MSSAPTQLAVAPTASNLVTPTAQIQKDYLEEPLARQNSLGNRVRGGLKGKHLTRSHAMRESASPPRTPTPRSDQVATSPVSNSYSSSSSETINDSNNKMHVQSSSLSTSPSSTTAETPSVIVTSQHSQQQQQQINNNTSSSNDNMNYNVVCNQSQLDVDFPKLTPPKSSKCPRNRDQSQSSSDKQHNQQQLNVNVTTNDYNNKIVYSSTADGNNSIESITISSSNTYNKNGNKMMMNDNLNMKSSSSSSSSSSNGQNNIQNTSNNNNTNTAQQVSQHQNWNRHQNSSSTAVIEQMNCNVQQQMVAVNSPNSNSPPLITTVAGNNNDKENRCPRIESQNSSNSGTFSHEENHSESPTDGLKNDRINKKHKSGANSKSSKPRLKNMGSSSSVEGGNSTSGFISRDSSTEQFTDQSGVDLVQFFKETLNKNPRDRSMLMKIEKDLIDLAHDTTRNEIKFPAMSSYNRMLIHRVAAFFGMEHNVDTATQQSVIVATTKQTRIPDIRFKSLIRDRLSDEPRRSILKRDTHSFEDPRQGFLMCPDRGLLDRKAKSFEEREEEYEKVRRRIFRGRDGNEINSTDDQHQQQHYWPWSSTENSDQSARMRQQQNNKLLKVHSLSSDARQDGRPSVSKSHSFGGYGGPPPSGGPLTRGDSVNSTKSAGPRLFSKQDSIGSTNTPWRLSPSSSGSIYHFDPSNLPPSQAVPSAMYNTKSVGINTTTMHRKKNEKIKKVGGGEMHNNGGNNDNNCAANTNSNNSNNNNHHHYQGGTGNGGGGSGSTSYSQGTESSMETLSESSSAQTILNACNNHDDSNIDCDAQELTKESHCHREMDDIQEEPTVSSLDDNDKTGTNYEHLNEIQQKPKVKNQATSPNIPSPEPEETQLNEVTTTNTNSIDSSSTTIEQQQSRQQQQNNTATATVTTAMANSTSSSPQIHGGNNSVEHTNKKENSDSYKIVSSNAPIMTYASSYQSVDGTTIFPPTGSGPYPATTYQQGPDGSVYAVPQPMIYAYPPPMEGEIQGYFMPVFDQSGGQRDANGTLLSTTAQAIYQPAGGATTATAVVPVAYPAAPYSSAPIYQGQVVYSPAEQFAPAVSAANQMQQYPMTYPVGYPYPYNGYWGQAMTYYVPQPIPGNAVSSSMIPPPITATAAVAGNNPVSVINNTNNASVGSNSKRNSPPQQNLTNGQGVSQSTTPANTYQFAPGVPLALTSDPNGPTMYAIPQSAVFPNMLPYGPPNAPAASAGVLAPLPHQPNAVISSLISHPSGPTGPPIPLEPTPTCTNYTISNVAGGNHGNNGGTPQSTPSTPLSNNISTNVTLPPQARNPPLFATPPIIPNGFNSQLHNQYPIDSHNTGATNSSTSMYDKKNTTSGGNKKNNSNNYASNSRQNSTYTPHNSQQQNPRKPNNTNDNSNNHSSNNNRQMHNNNSAQQQKRPNEKAQQNSIGLINNNVNSNIGNVLQNNSDSNNKQPRTGIRPKPGNLDLRRSASQRNSPSTNSIESNNNSPNSIASNTVSNHSNHNNNQNNVAVHDHSAPQQQSSMYMTRGTHIPPMHPPTTAAVVAAAAAAVANDPAAACHQQLIGTYNHPPAGMYIKYGQTYFAHPSMALPNNRRSPPNDLRPPLAPLTGVYPAVNMMLPAPRQMQPRHPNPNYKGSKPTR